jgi:hypothetical protein
MSVSAAQLQQLYLAYFGRPADVNGLQYYTSGDWDIWEVARAFGASPESQALYGATFDSPVVNAIYNNLFGRSAEPDGLLYWSNRIAFGELSAGEAALAILLGAQNADAAAVANKLTIAQAFAAHLDTSQEIAAYAGNEAAALVRGFMGAVTANPATVTAALAGLDTFIATLVAGPEADGTGGSLPNVAPTFSAMSGEVVTVAENTQAVINFSDIAAKGDEADSDGTVIAFVVKSVTSGTLLIGTTAGTATPWVAGRNDVVNGMHHAYWTPPANASGTLDAFAVVARDDGHLRSATPVQVQALVTAVNEAPSLTTFAGPVATITHFAQVAIGLSDLEAQGDETDVDGTVTAFVVTAVDSGTLLIGTSAGTAAAWAPGTNDVVDGTLNAYWTPDANPDGVLNAFTVVARDDEGLTSSTPVQAQVEYRGMTAGPDTFTATTATSLDILDATIDDNGTVDSGTLNDSDSITGNGETVVNVTIKDTAGGTPIVTMSGVATLNLVADGETSANFDASTWTTISEATLAGSDGISVGIDNLANNGPIGFAIAADPAGEIVISNSTIPVASGDASIGSTLFNSDADATGVHAVFADSGIAISAGAGDSVTVALADSGAGGLTVGDVGITGATSAMHVVVTLDAPGGALSVGNISVGPDDATGTRTDNLGDLFNWLLLTGATVTIGDVDYSAYTGDATINVKDYEGAGLIKGSSGTNAIVDNSGTNTIDLSASSAGTDMVYLLTSQSAVADSGTPYSGLGVVTAPLEAIDVIMGMDPGDRIFLWDPVTNYINSLELGGHFGINTASYSSYESFLEAAEVVVTDNEWVANVGWYAGNTYVAINNRGHVAEVVMVAGQHTFEFEHYWLVCLA